MRPNGRKLADLYRLQVFAGRGIVQASKVVGTSRVTVALTEYALTRL